MSHGPSSMEVGGTGPTLHHTGAPQVLDQSTAEAISVECVNPQHDTKVTTSGTYAPKTEMVWSDHNVISAASNMVVTMPNSHMSHATGVMPSWQGGSLHPFDPTATHAAMQTMPTPQHQSPYQTSGSIVSLPTTARTMPKAPLPRLPRELPTYKVIYSSQVCGLYSRPVSAVKVFF